MRRIATSLGLAAVCVTAFAPLAGASTGEFERTWGKDVTLGGTTGGEICTVAASCTVGVSGGLGGEFKTPQGTAADAAGNVYVADYGNHRIEMFDSSGAFLRAWGKDVIAGGGTGFEICTVAASCKEGVGGGLGGEVTLPVGVAIDASGGVYVADYGNQRIQKFDSSGNFQRAWGKDVVTGGGTGFEICTVAANCKTGAVGALGGEFSNPTGVGASAGGDVYATDQGGRRVQRFDSSGNFLSTWGKDVTVGGGTGPETCTVAASCQSGVTGSFGGEFNNPIGVAVDSQGDLYVGDYANRRIQKFDGSGNFQRAWGKDVDASVAGTGFEVCTVSAACKAGVSGGVLGGELEGPLNPSVDGAGNVYVADADSNRIQVFDVSGGFRQVWGKDVDSGGGTGYEICTVAANCKLGVIGGLGGELHQPFGTAVDPAGNVYVADYLNQRIQKFLEPTPPVEPPTEPPATPPDNSFAIGKLSGKKLAITVPGAGQITVTDAGTAKKKTLLKPSGATASAAGTVNVRLRLTKSAKKLLKKKRKVKVRAAIAFTPTGGTANRQDKALKIKKKR